MSKTCLVVDDVEVSRFVMREYMEELGFSVVEALDIDEAVAALKNQSFDVILLDWHLRQHSSLDLLHKLREVPGASHVPVVICSGVANGDVQDRVQTAGAQGYIQKPMSVAKIEHELVRLRVL